MDVEKDTIIEIAALGVVHGEVADRFHVLVRQDLPIPKKIIMLTGITDDVLQSEGVGIETAINRFISFVGDDLVVAHNASFDAAFIQAACEDCDLDDLDNDCLDTVSLTKAKLPKAPSYRLPTLLNILNLEKGIPIVPSLIAKPRFTFFAR